jgi:hypothetical protein
VKLLIRLATPVLIVLAFAIPATAQDAPPPPITTPAQVERADTVRISPRGAFVRSLVLPGWGQAYVGAPGRGAVYFAAEAGSLWMVYRSRQQLLAARELERHLIATDRLPATERLDLVLSRRQQQEDWITLAIFVLLFSGADAYVSAQLADFDDRFGVRPDSDGTLRMEARFPVGRRR